jgi:alanine racemase
MDQLLIDVTDFSEAHLGDVVTLIGGLTTADDLGEAAGTIAHEVLCRLMSRVPRRYDFG